MQVLRQPQAWNCCVKHVKTRSLDDTGQAAIMLLIESFSGERVDTGFERLSLREAQIKKSHAICAGLLGDLLEVEDGSVSIGCHSKSGLDFLYVENNILPMTIGNQQAQSKSWYFVKCYLLQ